MFVLARYKYFLVYLILHIYKLLLQQRNNFINSMAESGNTGTLEWTRPDQVMKLHRMKLKKRALQARMNKTNVDTTDSQRIAINLDRFNSRCNTAQRVPEKRKNPFAINDTCKKQQKSIPSVGLEISSDNTLFELLNINAQRQKQTTTDSSLDSSLTFANVLSKLESNDHTNDESVPKGEKYIPIDWTLKNKIRFMSPKPFPWNGKLKTSEQASGTTGFVRCLDIGERETTLDTSPNARLVALFFSPFFPILLMMFIGYLNQVSPVLLGVAAPIATMVGVVPTFRWQSKRQSCK